MARVRASLAGAPAVLWVGRLTANKDPLTVLRGFGLARQRLPHAHLHFVYQREDLLGVLREVCAAQPELDGVVHFHGAIPHEDLAAYLCAADLFVLGSHEEGSGYALLEALACGLPAVVTNIPSFRRATGRGRLGALWKPGSPQSFAEALQAAVQAPPERSEVRRFFEDNWSFPALGRSAAAIYQSAVRATWERGRPARSRLKASRLKAE